jgi:S-adenosyl-L-methionine hydrolase (adenosine-forming)
MSDAILTLTTDFGTKAPYVAAMKGVIVALNPVARLIDLSHDIPPQNVRHAAFFLAAALPYFPPGTIHVVVVDPGVGTERAILYVELGTQRLLAPDNGCWTLAAETLPLQHVRRVTNRSYWRDTISGTFHGRDIFAPVAAHLSRGVAPVQLGELVSQWVTLDELRPSILAGEVRGEVVFVDDFGNLITNLAPEAGTVLIGDCTVSRRVYTYGEAPPGTLVALTSSFDLLEIAEVQGNAARRLGAHVGTPVILRRAT